MSEVNLPSKGQAQQALQYMAEQVYGPAFFEKLAGYGVQPRNQAEAKQLLELGATLENAEQQGLYKSAQDEGNPFLSYVNDRLTGALRPVKQASANVAQGALNLVQQDATTKAAALTYAHVLAGGSLSD